MKEILYNLANLSLINYCKENNIDCSGTHITKYPRKWIYALVKDDTGRAVCTVSFKKNSIPCFTAH